MERILTILNVLDNSKNGILLIDTESTAVLGGNEQARKMFDLKRGKTPLDQVLGEDFTPDKFMENVIPSVMETEKCVIPDTFVVNAKGQKFACDYEFVLASDGMEYLFLIVRVEVDRRPMYLEMMLKRSKRPAFFLDYEDALQVRDGNLMFYRSFACTPENIGEKYDKLFDNFLTDETKTEDLEKIWDGIKNKTNAILEVPLQTADGKDLLFYFNRVILQPLLEPDEKCMFCLLVEKGETLEEVEYPYDKVQGVKK